MASLILDPDALSVRPTRAEKVAGLLGDVDVPWSAIASVTVEDDGLRATRGLRAPGLALPGRRKIGTWRGRGHRALVIVRAGEPALRIGLTGQNHDELLVSHPDARELAVELSRRAGVAASA